MLFLYPEMSSIGIFDSGVGGLTVLKEIMAVLPGMSCSYLGDGINAPYGTKAEQEIRSLSFRNTEFLLEIGCPIIVVACNTATTSAIDPLRKAFPKTHFVGIEPAIKPAFLQSKNKKVGVLATQGTVNSTLFNETYNRFGKDVEAIIQVGTGLVPLIEKGKLDSPELQALLQEHLLPMIKAEVDHIVLGCTHYPIIADQIKACFPYPITIIDSGQAVAIRTKSLIEDYALPISNGSNRLLTTAKPEDMNRIAKLLEIEGESSRVAIT
jgi:glutamate racemase